MEEVERGNRKGRPQSFAANVLGQLIRGLSQSLVNAGLPVVLVRLLPIHAFRAWAVVFSISLLIGYLDLGLSGGVAGVASRHLAEDNHRAARKIAKIAVRWMLYINLVLIALTVVVAFELRDLFPSIDGHQLAAAQVSLVLLSFAQCSNLMIGVISSWFLAHQKMLPLSWRLGIGRLAITALVVVVSFSTGSIVGASTVLAMGTGGLAFLLWNHFRIESRSSPSHHDAQESSIGLRDFISTTGALGIWSICLIMVSGLDVTVVGRLDYKDVAPYAIAGSIASLANGLILTVQTPLISRLAALSPKVSREDFVVRLIRILNLNGIALAGLAALSVLSIRCGIWHLIGPTNPTLGGKIAEILLAAVCVRLLTGPLALSFVALGVTSAVWLPPVLEGIINLTLSIVLCRIIGARGVAIGTLAGVVVAVLGVTFIGAKRIFGKAASRSIGLNIFVKPFAWAAPTILVSLSIPAGRFSDYGAAATFLATLAVFSYQSIRQDWSLFRSASNAIVEPIQKVQGPSLKEILANR